MMLNTKSWKVLLCIAMALGCLQITCSSVVAQSEIYDSKERVLRSLIAAVSSCDDMSMRIESSLEFIEEIEISPIKNERVAAELYRCASKELVSLTTTKAFVEGGESSQRNDYVIYDDGVVLSIQAELDENLEQVPISRSSLSLVLSNKHLVDARVRTKASVYNYLGDTATAVWILGHSPIVDYLEGNGELKAELTDGVAKVVSDGSLGSFEAELSKKNGWLPREFFIRKSMDTKLFGRPVRDLLIPEGEKNPDPAHLLRLVEWNGRVIEFETTAEQVIYASRIYVDFRMVFDSGAVNSTKCIIKLKDITHDSDESCETGILIPVDYPVGVDGAPHLPYKWDGHKAVPGIPDMPPRESSVVLGDNSKSYGGYFLAANLLVILLVLVLLARKRFVN